jgi:transposase
MCTKCRQINSEGCKIVGKGGAHETDTCSHPKLGAARSLRGVVSHPQGAPQDARPDGLAGGLAGSYGLRDRRDSASQSEETVRRWLKRYLAEGVEGLRDAPHPGAPRKVTEDYRERLVQAVRRRRRSLGLPFSLWRLQRLADYMAEQTAIRVEYETVRVHLKAQGIVLSCPQHTITSPDPEYALKKRRSKRPARTSEQQIISTTPTSST